MQKSVEVRLSRWRRYTRVLYSVSYWIQGDNLGYWPTAQAVRYNSAGDVEANRTKAKRLAAVLGVEALPEGEPLGEPWPGTDDFISPQDPAGPDTQEFRHPVTDDRLQRHFQTGTTDDQRRRR